MLYKRLFFALALGSCIGFTACIDRGNHDEDQGSGYTFESWDDDDDEIISNNEFENAFTTSPYFDKWNKDGNEYISQEEFYQNYAAMMDGDDDGNISSSEWDEAVNAYFTGYDYKPQNKYEEWDSDGNGSLSSQEVVSSLSETDYFNEWDNDGDEQLTEKEFARGTFTTWDTDGDGYVQAEEYAEWYDSGF